MDLWFYGRIIYYYFLHYDSIVPFALDNRFSHDLDGTLIDFLNIFLEMAGLVPQQQCA